MSDTVLVALLAAVVLAPAIGALAMWRAMRHYREEGALAHDTFTPGRPCRLELPDGGALDLMLRVGTTRSRGSSEPLTAVIEIVRGAGARRLAVGLSASAPRPEGMPFQGTDGAAFLVVKHGRESIRTKVLARIPAGGAGHVTVDLLAPGIEVGYCAAFVKPAK